MKVRLAGFNIENVAATHSVCSPEVLTAAYARVSRSEKTIEELRSQARENVEKARKSNVSIVYEMGHASIAEHAFFNIDIEDISRLALEELEKHRLASYTEKSQRYVKLDSDWHLPEEWMSHREHLGVLHEKSVQLYQDMLAGGIAGEDARYYLPLMMTGQVGLSCNARTAEHLILRLLSSPLTEVRELGVQLHQVLVHVVPSLIRYVDPSDWCRREEGLHFFSSPTANQEPHNVPRADNVFVQDVGVGTLDLCSSPDDWDAWVLATQELRKGASFASKLNEIRQWSPQQREEAFFNMMRGMTVHDPAPRAWEHVHITWELVISAAAYAQLKRHRLCDLVVSMYDPRLGFTHPPTVVGHWADRARALVQLSETTAQRINGPARAYALLSGHRRRVLWTANLREILHFSRLREDAHAQWDIRAFARAVSHTVQQHAPLCGRFLGGKDAMGGRLL